MGGVIFDLTETTYIEAVWYVSWPDADWMAMVYRDTPEAPWRATYRFRYYKDAEAWQSQDEKAIYEIRAKDGAAETVTKLAAGFDAVSAEIARQQQGQRWIMVVRGSADRFTDLLVKQPWAHVKVTPKAPAVPQ